jgi:hypothetical protein
VAAEYITDVIDPAELTGYVREQVDGDLPFATLFPPVQVEDIEYELTQLDSVAGQVAKYRSWDTAPPLGKRPGVTIIGGEIPPLGLSMRLNERDIIRFNRLRRDLADRFDQRVVDTIYADAVNMARAVQNRITLAHGELLTSGEVTLTELGEGIVAGNELKATFNVPAGQLNVAPAGDQWDVVATAVPLTDLLTWEETYRDANGGLSPDAWIMSTKAESYLMQSTQVRNQFVNAPTAYMPTSDEVRRAVGQRGVRGQIVISDIERPALDGSGTARVIPENVVVGVRYAALGSTLYGISANAATLAGNGTIEFTDAPGIVAFQEQQVRPPAVLTTAEGVALPVLRDPKALFVATVF